MLLWEQSRVTPSKMAGMVREGFWEMAVRRWCQHLILDKEPATRGTGEHGRWRSQTSFDYLCQWKKHWNEHSKIVDDSKVIHICPWILHGAHPDGLPIHRTAMLKSQKLRFGFQFLVLPAKAKEDGGSISNTYSVHPVQSESLPSGESWGMIKRVSIPERGELFSGFRR